MAKKERSDDSSAIFLRLRLGYVSAANNSIVSCSSLRSSRSSQNSLQTIPGPVFAAFTNIVELYLRENQITHLPPEIGLLSELDSLYLEDNLLTDLPKELR